MEILATESLEKLRLECKKDPKLIERSLDDLADEYGLSLISMGEKSFDLSDLILPEGYTQETNKDLENCKIISTSLSSLTAAEATDERVWATLSFGLYSSYVKLRWPVKRAPNQVNHVQEHWFARTARNRLRDNAIARLWWMAHIAQRVPDASYEEVLKTLFFNSDYRSSLLERNSSANAINVVICILNISQKAFSDGIEFERIKFREFMKSVDFIGKRTSLPSLSLKQLEELLTPHYYEAYKVTKPGILGRIFKS